MSYSTTCLEVYDNPLSNKRQNEKNVKIYVDLNIVHIQQKHKLDFKGDGEDGPKHF